MRANTLIIALAFIAVGLHLANLQDKIDQIEIYREVSECLNYSN
jgi:hypothetical protein